MTATVINEHYYYYYYYYFICVFFKVFSQHRLVFKYRGEIVWWVKIRQFLRAVNQYAPEPNECTRNLFRGRAEPNRANRNCLIYYAMRASLLQL